MDTQKIAINRRLLVFHPFIVLLCSLAGAAFWAMYMLRSPSTRATMFVPTGPFAYVVPIVVPFVAFLFDRAERFRSFSFAHHIMDFLVVATAMGRVVGNVPFISGHTLFLTYALLSTKSVVLRLTAGVVMLQAIVLKYFVWHDFVTSTSGIVLGLLAAFVAKHFEAKYSQRQLGS
jgi:hypothetical protein